MGGPEEIGYHFAPIYGLMVATIITFELSPAIRNGYDLQTWMYIAFLVLITVGEAILAIQWWQSRTEDNERTDVPGAQKRKKQPKHRKDYH